MNLASPRLNDSSPSVTSACVSASRSAASRRDVSELLRDVPPSPASAGEAYECLSLVSALLRAAGDPRAAFTDVYSVITRRVRDAVNDPTAGLFDEPQFISRLAGRFCTLYLAALRRSLAGEPEPVAAWAVADQKSGSRWTLPVQHALLGLNAHINYDLALGLFANVSALGGERDPARMARYRHDHDAVNLILEAAIPEVLELLSTRYGCPVSKLVLAAREGTRRAACRATMRTLAVWRSRVWDDLLTMLAVRETRGFARIEARMNLRAGVLARLLGVELPVL